ncbi:DUF4145 domain-containing protein [Secundilactobacillus kimchicus]|uniref:DUF4145 domain-containing protein n=1 Tax=Secundilactobacillus kimchicus TaxID=528209 RepID=UPI0024A8038C|nr:DUF4145 domain-containing protein [Secundilactobacillus kimchicus]
MVIVSGFENSWEWGSTSIIKASYTCGYCGRYVASNQGMPWKKFTGSFFSNIEPYGVFVCTNCHMPTFIYRDVQVPGNLFGNPISGVPDNVNAIYEEARQAYSVNAYTGVILLSRILLMHVSVNLGAEDPSNFAQAINYLKDNNYIPTTSEEWVDSIRKIGNRTNHDLTVNTKSEAETIIKFSEMLLRINYEYPDLASKMLSDNSDK